MSKEREESQQRIEIVDTFGVLKAEYSKIWPDKPEPADTDDYNRRAYGNGQAALCLSGGGIRSASFALGVIQALTRKGLLTKFHYLSTVSGGGYIGSWLQRWIHEEDGQAAIVEEALQQAKHEPEDSNAGTGETAAAAELNRSAEPDQIKALRENSNFLTPRIGLGSTDTWTAVAIATRNIVVNWLLFAPLLLLVVMVPNLFVDILTWLSGFTVTFWPQLVPILLSMVCAWRAAWFTCKALPSYRGEGWPLEKRAAGNAVKTRATGDGWLMRKIVIWLILWALLGSVALWMDLQMSSDDRDRTKIAAKGFIPPQVMLAGVAFAGLSLVTALIALIVAGSRLPKAEDGKNYRATFRKDVMLWFWALFFGAAVVALGCNIFLRVFCEAGCDSAPVKWFATLAPLWLMFSQLLVAFLFAAFRRDRADRARGTVNADSDREWLARLSAIKMRPMLLWAVLATAVLLLVPWLESWKSGSGISVTGLVALASGATAVSGGRGPRTGSTTRQATATLLRYLPLSGIVTLATFLFGIALLAVFSAFENFLVTLATTKFDAAGVALGWSIPYWPDPDISGHLVLAAALVGALLLLNRRIPVNRFSLSGLYRNRLGRAFLGGARPAESRNPDAFTGFDPGDNVDLHELRPHTGDGMVLYPVINVALNVTASDNLAWQERKAEPFILSPLYCGSAMLSPEVILRERMTAEAAAAAAAEDEKAADNDVKKRSGVYICSRCYAGSEPEMKQPNSGISLATAVAISGAAASPNMGYHSSPATAFLMTLFNVRLGQWMPNPARAETLGDRVYRASPSSSLRALLRELGGSTDDKGLEVYLSDGGHFENLALYEMVRRRCQFIVLSDAGADPDCAFVDLGNAIRKVKIDLGIDIEFKRMRISSRTRQIEAQQAWAVGTIHYPEGKKGRILYIKPSFYDRLLPMDVVAYAQGSKSFPHESTGDQFFSESQFESYRKLGFFLTLDIAARDTPYESLEKFFEGLKDDDAQETEADQKLKGRFMAWLRGLKG